MRVLGVDPGARWTGIVLVSAFGGRVEKLLYWETIERSAGGVVLPLPAEYTNQVLAVLNAIESEPQLGFDLVGIEGVNRPSWHMGGRAAANPEAIMGTAWLGGIVQGAYPEESRIVTPGGNGAGALSSYPEQLVSSSERRRANWKGTIGGPKAKLRHVRSAYDVARVAAQMWKVK